MSFFILDLSIHITCISLRQWPSELKWIATENSFLVPILERCSIIRSFSRLLVSPTCTVLSQALQTMAYTTFSDSQSTWNAMLNSFFLSDDCSLSVAIMSGHTLQFFFPQMYDPLHSFLRSVLFVLLCTKMSVRFLCHLNAVIDGSG